MGRERRYSIHTQSTTASPDQSPLSGRSSSLRHKWPPLDRHALDQELQHQLQSSSNTRGSMGGGGRQQHMYFLEGGLLVVGNLLKTGEWVNDQARTHCNVCVQQFSPFRRRHHCRTVR